jgi:hypothetical protein
MKYLNLHYIYSIVVSALLITSCGTQDVIPQVETVEEPSKSIDAGTEAKNTEVVSDGINYAIYIDSKTKISFVYPENWQQIPLMNMMWSSEAQ